MSRQVFGMIDTLEGMTRVVESRERGFCDLCFDIYTTDKQITLDDRLAEQLIAALTRFRESLAKR